MHVLHPPLIISLAVIFRLESQPQGMNLCKGFNVHDQTDFYKGLTLQTSHISTHIPKHLLEKKKKKYLDR